MPDWQPPWSDIRFDHAAARHASEVCRAASRRIRSEWSAREALAREASTDWAGRYRDDFDRNFATQQRWLVHLAARLVAQADRIDRAAETASQMQSDREAARERWRHEAAAEERAEAEGRVEAER